MVTVTKHSFNWHMSLDNHILEICQLYVYAISIVFEMLRLDSMSGEMKMASTNGVE